MLAGQVIVGAAVSTTVTLKLQPPPVADVTTTVVVPIGKNDPEAGVAVIVPQLPNPSAAPNVTLAPPPSP